MAWGQEQPYQVGNVLKWCVFSLWKGRFFDHAWGWNPASSILFFGRFLFLKQGAGNKRMKSWNTLRIVEIESIQFAFVDFNFCPSPFFGCKLICCQCCQEPTRWILYCSAATAEIPKSILRHCFCWEPQGCESSVWFQETGKHDVFFLKCIDLYWLMMCCVVFLQFSWVRVLHVLRPIVQRNTNIVKTWSPTKSCRDTCCSGYVRTTDYVNSQLPLDFYRLSLKQQETSKQHYNIYKQFNKNISIIANITYIVWELTK